MTDELAQPWADWAARRPEFRGRHLDSAAAGRGSLAVLQAVADHALLESQVGAYVAHEAALPVLAAGRAELAALIGVAADGVAFTQSAAAALRALLTTWPLSSQATFGVLASEWGPNLEMLTAYGGTVVELPADGCGVLDLDAFERVLASSPPSVVHLTQVAAHRGLVQPVAAAATLCRAAGVPLWVDAAQALGHVDAASGADAVYAVGRKWMCGPRGVGVLGVAERWWDQLRLPASAMLAADWPIVQRLEAEDGHVAGRVGLCAAVHDYAALGPAGVWQRLDVVGQLTRDTLAELPGWALVPGTGSGAITALRPAGGQDVTAVRNRLLAEDRILVTAELPARAPREMTTPLLRVSPHVDCTTDDLLALRAALT